MLFDGNEINKISQENRSRGGDNRLKIPIGVSLFTMTSISLVTTTGDKPVPKLVLEYTKDEAHKPAKAQLKLSGEYSEIDRSKVVDWFERAFGYIIQPCNSGEDLVQQLKQFQGRKFKGAVRHRKSLYTAKETGEVMIVRFVDLWYVGAETDAAFTMNITKGIVELGTKDMDRVVQLKNMGQTVPDTDDDGPKMPHTDAVNAAANSTSSNPGDIVTSNGNDDNPFA